jgi:hypothetical protein
MEVNLAHGLTPVALEFGTSLWVMLVLVLEITLRSKGTPTVPPQLDHEKLDVLVDRFSP